MGEESTQGTAIRKRLAFRAGNLPELQNLKKEVKHEIKRTKRSFRANLGTTI